MRPFEEGHGYWLCVPKPWNGRKFKHVGENDERRSKCRRVEEIVRRLASATKWRKPYQHHLHYTEGQSLFVLPKTLSKGIRQWKQYESRFNRWLEENTIRKACTTQDCSAVAQNSRCTSNESRLQHSLIFEEDPLRAFYTIWHSNMNKVSKNKLSTSKKVFEYIDSIWRSDAVERSILKTPRGGVSGRIDDPSSLSAKARATLQRWSRIVSHYDVGNESGEDDDPVDMWNRSVEASMANSDALSPASLSPLWRSSSRKRTHGVSQIAKDNEIVESPVLTNTTVQPVVVASRGETSCENAAHFPENSSEMRSSPSTESQNMESDENMSLHAFPSKDSLMENDENISLHAFPSKDSLKVISPESRTQFVSKQVKDCQNDKTSSGSQRRSERIQLRKSAHSTLTPSSTCAPTTRSKAATTSPPSTSKSDVSTIDYETPKARFHSSKRSRNIEKLNCESETALRPNSRKRKRKGILNSSGNIKSEGMNEAIPSTSTPLNTSSLKKSNILGKLSNGNSTINSKSSSKKSATVKVATSPKRTRIVNRMVSSEKKISTLQSTSKKVLRRKSASVTKV